MEMDHKSRSAWLAGIVSPRPLILASTVDDNGVKNLAPLSSVMGVSNTPPLFVASFSKNKQKQYRVLYSICEVPKKQFFMLCQHFTIG